MVFEIPAAEPSSKQLAHDCAEASENAIEWVKSMSGITLDYSPQSLMALDRVLEALIPMLAKEDEEATVVMLGSYLGEVILRTCGGRWEMGDVFAGPGLRGIGGREMTINPFSRVRQAFEKMEPFHLSVYWNSIVNRMSSAKFLDDRSGFRPPPEENIKMLPVSVPEDKGSDGPSDEELAETIPDETIKFIQLLRQDLGVQLDYSLESLKFLDHYLKSLNEAMQEEGNMGEKRVFVYLAGNYLGEVLRKSFGGRWVYIPEQQTSGLILREGADALTVYPHQAAAKLAMEYQQGGVITYLDKIKQRLGVR